MDRKQTDNGQKRGWKMNGKWKDNRQKMTTKWTKSEQRIDRK